MKAVLESALILILLPWLAHAGEEPDARPNIVFILADDLSFHSIGAYGGERYQFGPRDALTVDAPVETPHLDALAAGGVRFNTVYANPVCTPARAMFLTGKYNQRIGFPDIAGRNGAAEELDVAEHVTLAQLLRDAGYATAVAGKWHLLKNNTGIVRHKAETESSMAHVTAAGFERQRIDNNNHMREYWDPATGEYKPDWMQAWALDFVSEQAADPSRPFFLYYAHPAPHEPWRSTPLDDGPQDNSEDDPANFPAIIKYMDQQIGGLLAHLESLGIAENTIVIFSGDNGTQNLRTLMDDGRVFSAGKFVLGENGKVPLIVSWPGTITPGRVLDDLVDFTDMMPTLLEIAGVPAPEGLDGVSFAPRLFGQPGTPRAWIHQLWKDKYIIRGHRYGLREDGTLYDLENATGMGRTINPENATPESEAAREFLKGVEEQLFPNGWPTDVSDSARNMSIGPVGLTAKVPQNFEMTIPMDDFRFVNLPAGCDDKISIGHGLTGIACANGQFHRPLPAGVIEREMSTGIGDSSRLFTLPGIAPHQLNHNHLTPRGRAVAQRFGHSLPYGDVSIRSEIVDPCGSVDQP